MTSMKPPWLWYSRKAGVIIRWYLRVGNIKVHGSSDPTTRQIRLTPSNLLSMPQSSGNQRAGDHGGHTTAVSTRRSSPRLEHCWREYEDGQEKRSKAPEGVALRSTGWSHTGGRRRPK